jgi:hypothetical protein
MGDTCIHCALSRALEVERAALESAGLEIELAHAPPVRVPRPAATVCLSLRRLLREARAAAQSGPLKLSIRDSLGASAIEVAIAVRTPRGVRILARRFARHAPGTLEGGFCEALAPA